MFCRQSISKFYKSNSITNNFFFLNFAKKSKKKILKISALADNSWSDEVQQKRKEEGGREIQDRKRRALHELLYIKIGKWDYYTGF